MSNEDPARPSDDTRLLEAMANLAKSHRDHERFYGSAPRESAVRLQRHARTLQALADQWSTATPEAHEPVSPYEGADDLNASAAIQLDGVLFLEGEGEPAEIAGIKRELRTMAADAENTGEWLTTAMQASWAFAAVLLEIDALADQIGERHRIIANDFRAASMNSVAGRVLERAAAILDTIDFSPTALRQDIAGDGLSARRLYSAAEMIAHAADLASDSAGLVHDNERRWRVFRSRVVPLIEARTGTGAPGEPTDPA